MLTEPKKINVVIKACPFYKVKKLMMRVFNKKVRQTGWSKMKVFPVHLTQAKAFSLEMANGKNWNAIVLTSMFFFDYQQMPTCGSWVASFSNDFRLNPLFWEFLIGYMMKNMLHQKHLKLIFWNMIN